MMQDYDGWWDDRAAELDEIEYRKALASFAQGVLGLRDDTDLAPKYGAPVEEGW